MASSFKVPFDSCNENITFIIGIKRHLFYPGHSFFVETKIHLCAEFHWRRCLSADNRSDVWLADTDNPVRNRVYFVLKHVLLLFIDFVNHSKPFGLLWCKFVLCVQKFVDVFSVSADILELLLDRFADFFASALFALCQIQIIFSGIPAVHPWNVIIKSSAEVIDDPFQVFPRLIQKSYILWKRDILRCTGCIKDQRSVVLSHICFWRIRVAFPARRWIIRGVVYNDHLVDFAKDVICQTLAELYKKRWYKGRFRLVSQHPDEILEIRIFRDSFNQLPVRKNELFLNKQGFQCHPERLCGHSRFTWKQFCILFLNGIPGNCFGFLNPAVFLIHF